MEENRTILIIDDEPETLKGYQEFLTPKAPAPVRTSSRQAYGTGPDRTPALENYRLLLASSGEEAIKIVQAEMKAGQRIAAGFFDVKLEGGMDGLATIHAIKAMDRDIHCVVVTAYQDRTVEEINQLFGEEFKAQWDYLNKPFTQGEIVQKARQMLAAWNRERRIEHLHQQLVKSERMAAVGQVARGIGHEFGNILLRIMGKADLALSERDPAKVKENLQVLLQAAERAGVIVRNLQSFSRPEPQFAHESIGKPLEDCTVLITHELVKSSVKLVKDLKPTPQIRIDTGALSQVFLNLMINAIHAMPKGGTLTLRTEVASDAQGKSWVVGRISDTGTGIPQEVLPRIFEYAFSTKGDKGSGLGLSISKDIVDSHGGKIEVKTDPGKGSEFSVWLPAEAGKA